MGSRGKQPPVRGQAAKPLEGDGILLIQSYIFAFIFNEEKYCKTYSTCKNLESMAVWFIISVGMIKL